MANSVLSLNFLSIVLHVSQTDPIFVEFPYIRFGVW